MTQEQGLLTVAEAAAKLGIPDQAVRCYLSKHRELVQLGERHGRGRLFLVHERDLPRLRAYLLDHDGEPLVSPCGAGSLVGEQEFTIRAAIRRGELAPVKRGPITFLRRSDVLSWAARRPSGAR